MVQVGVEKFEHLQLLLTVYCLNFIATKAQFDGLEMREGKRGREKEELLFSG